MTDKVQKIREWVEKLKSQLIRGACSSQIAMETRCKEEAYNEVISLLDSLQEEPEPQFKVGDTIRSKHWNTAVHKIISMDDKSYCLDNGGKVDLPAQQLWELVEEPVSEDLEEVAMQFATDTETGKVDVVKQSSFFWGAIYHKQQMMAKAIDGTARPDDNEIWCNLKFFNFKDGDKVKVIVIKED